jgi:hypothetical protein
VKSLWQPASRAELLARAARLTPAHRPRWGRMTVEQMLSHLVQTCRMGTGELPVRPVKLVTRHWPLNVLIAYFMPFPRGLPTVKPLIARAPEGLDRDLATLAECLDAFARSAGRTQWPEHPALGRLSGRAWAVLGWRHMDHHLRQFGV